MSRIRIGISACLLGEQVRYDGGHKRNAVLIDILGPHVEWVRVCPEVEVGMGTPREPLRLIRSGGRIRMLTIQSAVDYTDTMNDWARRRVEELTREDLCGYVLKKDSPSCGMEDVKVYDASGVPGRPSRGLFARVLLERMPFLPVEDEGRLSDPHIRENFIERIFALRRVKDLFETRWTVRSLARFNRAQETALRGHSPAAYDKLERLIAGAARMSRDELRMAYQEQFMAAMGIRDHG